MIRGPEFKDKTTRSNQLWQVATSSSLARVGTISPPCSTTSRATSWPGCSAQPCAHHGDARPDPHTNVVHRPRHLDSAECTKKSASESERPDRRGMNGNHHIHIDMEATLPPSGLTATLSSFGSSIRNIVISRSVAMELFRLDCPH